MHKKNIFLFLIFVAIQGVFAGVRLPKKALLIGISNYPKSNGWAPISCQNDIKYLNSTLLKNDFSPRDIKILEDSLATKSGILDELQKLATNSQAGDIIFIYFSGHGQQIEDDNGDESDSLDECLVPYDAHVRLKPGFYQGEKHIRDDELILLLNNIRRKIGLNGQLIFSTDASHSGPDVETEKLRNVPKSMSRISGRGGIFEEFSNKDFQMEELSPVIIMAACLNTEFGYETMDDSGTSFGLFTYAFCKALNNKKFNEYKNYSELFDSAKAIAKRKFPKQHPSIAGDIMESVFTSSITPKVVLNPPNKKQIKANCYVISVGINSYKTTTNSNLPSTQNSVSDAILFANFIKKSFNLISNDSFKCYPILLTNKNATGKDILDSLNKIITYSKPDDFFIFNFAGITRTYYDTSDNKSVTYFFPSDINDIFDSIEIKRKAISLFKLKNLLDLIPANNQLIITEAGSTDNFQKEFIKILIENSSAISSITKRNRIIIVPGSFGRDEFECNEKLISGGPLNYFITHLSDKQNIFGLFYEDMRDGVEKEIIKNEMDCNFSSTIYTQFFFERKFIEDLQYFLPENMMKTRGSKVINEDKNAFKKIINGKHALILGTNIYGGKPQWNDLANPELDAIEIANELRKSYGFETKLMLNPSQDSLYAALFHYSQTLDTNDQLIIFFAGHGDFDEKYFDDGFIVLNNSATTKNDPYRKTYIQHTELQRMINKLPPKQIMVVMDVCFGGTFDERVIKLRGRNKNDMYSDQNASSFVSSKLKYTTRIYITSGGKKEVPDGYQGKHSPFALKFLEALRTEGGNNGFLTASEMYAFVQRLPSGPLMGNFGDHEIGGEFMLVPKK